MDTISKRKPIVCRRLFLQTALLMAILYVPTTSGIDCYCSNAPSAFLPLCHWDGYSCTGDVCYVRKVRRDNGVTYTTWGCLHEGEDHIGLICHDGAFNTDIEQYSCCTDSTNCNEHLEVILPIDLPPPTTAVEEDTSSGSGGDGFVPSTGEPSTSGPPVPDSQPPTTTVATSLPVPTPSTIVSSTSLLPRASLSPPSSSQPAVPDVSSLPPLPDVSSLPPLPTVTPGSQLLCSCSNCDSGTVSCGPGGSCFVRVDSDLQGRSDNGLNPRPLSWGCMNATESMKKCERGSEEYLCCASGDLCNQQLLAEMREQPTVETTSTSDGCASGDCQSVDRLKIITIAVVLPVSLIFSLTLLILLALLLTRIRGEHMKRIPVSTEGSSRSDSRVNSVSTELDSVNGGSPTSKSSPHHLLHIQVVPHVCQREHVFGDSDNCST